MHCCEGLASEIRLCRRVASLIASGAIDEAEAPARRSTVYDEMAREAPPSSTDGKASCFAAEELPKRMAAGERAHASSQHPMR